MEKSSVVVKIFNDEYTLKTDMKPCDVEKISTIVDQKMKKLASCGQSVTTARVAVWAALDFAGELYKLKREYAALLKATKKDREEGFY